MSPKTTSKVTTDHDAIRCWAEQRNAKPTVCSARNNDDDPGTVRLEFPGSRDNGMKEISWDQWFAKFERGKLALLYQEQTADGERSNFYKMVRREIADQVESAVGGRGRSAARRKSKQPAAAADEAASGERGRSSEDQSETAEIQAV
jgi:hypothetical protein